jgi:hypothetical protein
MDWTDMYDRADGSHMTQMDVEGGRTLTIAAVEQTTMQGKRRALVHWQEDVLPWLMPQQEALLLKSCGWSRELAVGRRLFLQRDPSVRFGKDTVGGSRIHGSPDLERDLDVQWRCGTRTLRRRLHRTDDPDPLHGLVVVRMGLSPAVVDAWAQSQDKPAPFSATGARRVAFAKALDTDENRAAIRAFAAEQAASGD